MPLSQSTIKYLSSLRQKKFRQSYHKFTVEGEKIVDELLAQSAYRVDHVYALPAWWEKRGLATDEIAFRLQSSQTNNKSNIDLGKLIDSTQPLTGSIITEKELGRISQLTSPNQVIAVVDLPDTVNALIPDLGTQWSIYLDGIQSPANLGAILRVADWFGFQHVFGGTGTADLYNSKSIQATMGTFLRVTYREVSLSDVLANQSDLPVFAADLTGKDIFQFSPPSGGLLVIGNEGKGVRPETRELVTDYLLIPRAPDRAAESLNAAVATGILCGLLNR